MMLARMLTIYLVLGRTFGRWLSPMPIGLLFLVRIAVVTVAQPVDLLLPRVRRCVPSQPIVLVGSPRSGTTFLHRYLDSLGIGTGLRVWDCLCPSVVLQRLLGPLTSRIAGSNRARGYDNGAHETGLMLVDTDDAAIMVRFLDGALLQGWFHAFSLKFEIAETGPRTDVRDFEWLRRVWRRALVTRGGTRIVAKLHSLSHRLPRFLAAMPDAKVVYLIRDPEESIPSAMSLVTTMLEKRFGFWRLPPEVRSQYLVNLYQMLIWGYRRFIEDWESGSIDRKRVMIVRYDQMMRDFSGTMDELLRFVGHIPDGHQKAAIEATAAAQRRYVSRHKYDAARYGLDPLQIRRDCQFVYDVLLPPLTSSEVA
jgi:omega-hydroxy-beta-dihydromenaquinone-9 sulfotransferase